MLQGINTSSTGMLAIERLQETLANDLTNVETPGFKSSNGQMLEFAHQLQYAMNYNGGTKETPIGGMGYGVLYQEGVPVFTQGSLSSTNRGLDVALVDTTPPGTYASVAQGNSVQSVQGNISTNVGGILSVNGTPLAVLDASGNAVPNVHAMKNPNYQGTALVASTGKPNYDANGQPSYLFVNNKNQVIGSPANPEYQNMSLRVGNNTDMGEHSFFAVAYQSYQGDNGIALTKDGSFNVNSQNQLVDASGNAVLPVDANGNVLYNDRIVINSNYTGKDIFDQNGNPITDSSGQPSYRVVDAAGNPVAGAHLGSVNVDVTKLTPLGQTEFMVGNTFTPAQVTTNLTAGTAQLRPGELEQSNVDTTSIMTKMLTAQSLYQANQQAMSVADGTLSDAISKVGVNSNL